MELELDDVRAIGVLMDVVSTFPSLLKKTAEQHNVTPEMMMGLQMKVEEFLDECD